MADGITPPPLGKKKCDEEVQILPHSHIQQLLFCCRISQRDTLWERPWWISSDCLLDFPYSVKAFCLHPYLANKVNLSAEFFQVKIMKRNVLFNKCDPSLIWFRFSLPHMCICTVLSSSLSAQRCERQAKNVAV